MENAKVALAFIAIALIVASLVAFVSLAGPPGNSIVVEVVNDSNGLPVVGMTVAAGPVSYAHGLYSTLNFVTLSGCVVKEPNGEVWTMEASPLYPNGTVVYPSCPMRSYVTNFLGQVYIRNATGSQYLIEADGGVGESVATVLNTNGTKGILVVISWPSGNVSVI